MEVRFLPRHSGRVPWPRGGGGSGGAPRRAPLPIPCVLMLLRGGGGRRARRTLRCEWASGRAADGGVAAGGGQEAYHSDSAIPERQSRARRQVVARAWCRHSSARARRASRAASLTWITWAIKQPGDDFDHFEFSAQYARGA